MITFPDNRWTNDISTTNYLPITTIMTCTNQSSVIYINILEYQIKFTVLRKQCRKFSHGFQHVLISYLISHITVLFCWQLPVPSFYLTRRCYHHYLLYFRIPYRHMYHFCDLSHTQWDHRHQCSFNSRNRFDS